MKLLIDYLLSIIVTEKCLVRFQPFEDDLEIDESSKAILLCCSINENHKKWLEATGNISTITLVPSGLKESQSFVIASLELALKESVERIFDFPTIFPLFNAEYDMSIIQFLSFYLSSNYESINTYTIGSGSSNFVNKLQLNKYTTNNGKRCSLIIFDKRLDLASYAQHSDNLIDHKDYSTVDQKEGLSLLRKNVLEVLSENLEDFKPPKILGKVTLAQLTKFANCIPPESPLWFTQARVLELLRIVIKCLESSEQQHWTTLLGFEKILFASLAENAATSIEPVLDQLLNFISMSTTKTSGLPFEKLLCLIVYTALKLEAWHCVCYPEMQPENARQKIQNFFKKLRAGCRERYSQSSVIKPIVTPESGTPFYKSFFTSFMEKLTDQTLPDVPGVYQNESRIPNVLGSYISKIVKPNSSVTHPMAADAVYVVVLSGLTAWELKQSLPFVNEKIKIINLGYCTQTDLIQQLLN
ncbi:hypothetical protein O9G_002931 [Rozella allomycis CSF55]|uniref:Sec1-like protein n=1 Tax=Rozella allomycis (strain CSF55) TaxID=988480 RepID=A0A075ANL0_ROZAC|nr:hypothetical protein O9G_002931 [Rozella allomycis CSF55]|eukprot:EPZ31462.1 hypothetical protein O9G_002931 [Rozella allomycis CSF55]